MVTEQDITSLIDQVFLTTLGLPTRPLAPGEDQRLPSEPTLDGMVNITGAWQGTVVLQVSRPLGARIATAMFARGDAPPSPEDVQDALGELANMMGGNIKALLTGECHLSLPAVVEGRAYTIRVPSSRVVTRVAFECDGRPAAVSLMALAAADGRRPA